MKSLCASTAALLLASQVQGQFIYEPFDYAPNSTLSGQGGWFWPGDQNQTARISAGNLALPSGMPAPVGNSVGTGATSTYVRLPFATAITSGSVYYSFAFRLDNIGSVGGVLPYRSLATIGTGINSSGAPTIKTFADSFTTYQISVSKGGNGVLAPNIFNQGDTIFLVASYTFNPGIGDDTCNLWLNPDPSTLGGATPPVPTVQGVGVGLNDVGYMAAFTLMSQSAPYYTFDELRIGTSWQDVTPVPEPAALVQLLLGASLLLFYCKRKRNP